MDNEQIDLLLLDNENIIGLEIFTQGKKYLQQKETFGVKTKASTANIKRDEENNSLFYNMTIGNYEQ